MTVSEALSWKEAKRIQTEVDSPGRDIRGFHHHGLEDVKWVETPSCAATSLDDINDQVSAHVSKRLGVVDGISRNIPGSRVCGRFWIFLCK